MRLVIVLFFLIHCVAVSAQFSGDNPPQKQPAPNEAILFVGTFGTYISDKWWIEVSLDGKKWGTLSSKSYVWAVLKPGEYVIGLKNEEQNARKTQIIFLPPGEISCYEARLLKDVIAGITAVNFNLLAPGSSRNFVEKCKDVTIKN